MTPDGAMKVLKVIGMVLLGIIALVAFGFIVQLLWNWLMPGIFKLREITYWEGLGILALSSILFGRLGGGGGKSGGSDRKRKQKLRSYLREQYEAEKAKSGCAGE